MSDIHPTCLFTEGRVTIPGNYQERTVNVFIPLTPETPTINISRDFPAENETFSAYIERQLTLMQTHLQGWALAERAPCVLGDNLLQGESLYSNYLRDNNRFWQKQAVFIMPDNHILAFTMIAPELSDAANAQFQDMLASFRFNA